MTTKEIRENFLNFYKNKKHAILPSASLIPENDPTTLFTGSGTQPMVPYLLGENHPAGRRIADSQKCFRTQDIEEVGDSHHTTFFEMLGNWSLGDYFKKEQISWLFNFLIKEVKLDPRRLYVTVFKGNDKLDLKRDEEAAAIWQNLFHQTGIEAKISEEPEKTGLREGERIFFYDEAKNWWSRVGKPSAMPVGEPGGPDSEIFWDFGAHLGLHERSKFKNQPCHINCDCGRFFEIGNSVFMAYQKTTSGFVELKNKNIDFGGGLERITTAANDIPDIYLIDVFAKPKSYLESITKRKYSEEQDKKPFRVILDHLRAATFLLADSAYPSNKDQGYFTRRLLRRAIRFGRELGISHDFCSTIIELFITEYKDSYPELEKRKGVIIKEANKEEGKFRKTLDRGLKEFNKLVAKNSISGMDAFTLFSTYGFPLELTEELAKEKNNKINRREFMEEFKKHQNLSRQGGEKKFKGGLADASSQTIKYHTATHLLHQALKDVLGDHVKQKGSNINEKRLRFDFSHPEKMTDEQKKKVEEIINNKISQALPVNCEEMSYKRAKELGAVGLFADKYGSNVKVYSVGDYSKEICGGPHVQNIKNLGHFRIIKEESSSEGVRRIKAILE